MGTVAIIPARSGSKGIPNKNLVSFRGRPLIEWTIRAAQESGAFGRVVVSTDSEKIAEFSRQIGADIPFMRPPELSNDTAPTMAVVLHALSYFDDAETVVLLQPTSPLRDAGDIRAAMELFKSAGCERPVVAMSPAKPWLFTQSDDGGAEPLTETVDRRQSVDAISPNGSIYIISADQLRAGETWWNRPLVYLMPPERSVDIDTPVDLVVAAALASHQVTSLTQEQAHHIIG